MRGLTIVIIATCLACVIFSCKTKPPMEAETVMGNLEKFDFDVNALDKDGLIGPANGKVSVDYQFCFPKGKAFENKILAIDAEIKIIEESKGRSGCSKTQSVAFGTTHKPGHKDILNKLSKLEFVKRIKRVYYE